VEPEANGKKSYKNIFVQKDNPLWTVPPGQQILVAGQAMEVVRKVEEREYGREGAAAQRKALKARA
jgi:hypothetical protein